MAASIKTSSKSIHRLTRRVRFPPHWPPIGIHPNIPREKIHPTPYAFEELAQPRVFVEKKGLYTGPGKWSQVYRGAFLSLSELGEDIDASSKKGVDDIVLKVYKSNLFPYPASHPDVMEATPPWCASRNNSYRWTDELMCWAEIYAYSTLLPLQGAAVPKFIDAFMVDSPGFEEESLAIAMSYVKGKPIVEVCQSLGSDDDSDLHWYPIGLDLLRKVHAIRQHGIISFDVRSSNVFVEEVNGSSSAQDKREYSVKILDFAMSRPFNFPSATLIGEGRVELLRKVDILKFEELLMEICGDEIDRVYPKGYDLAGPHRRRSEFLKWVYKNYADEQCVQDFWPVLKKFVFEKYPVIPSKTDNFSWQ